MEHIRIRAHPPWYARGTPVLKKTKDGGRKLSEAKSRPKASGLEAERSELKSRSKASGLENGNAKIRGKPPLCLSFRRKNLLFARHPELVSGSVNEQTESMGFLSRVLGIEMTAFGEHVKAEIRGKPSSDLSSRRGTRRDLQQWNRFLSHTSFEMTAFGERVKAGIRGKPPFQFVMATKNNLSRHNGMEGSFLTKKHPLLFPFGAGTILFKMTEKKGFFLSG